MTNNSTNIHSPIALTVVGNEVLRLSGGKEYLDNNIDALIKDLEDENLRTALDVQNFSSSLLFQKTEDEGFNVIKSFVYHNPKFKKVDITLAPVINVMSIYLRDKYLKKYTDLA